jgi:hypothetical protein
VRLCADALKRSEGGEIRLRALRITAGVRIVVMDDGRAPNEEVDATTRALAEALGAEVNESHDEAGGSVSLTFPLTDALAPTTQESEASAVDQMIERLARELLVRPGSV